MKPKTRSIEQIIEEQVRRWQIIRTEEKKADERISVITISREPGSGGNILAERLSQPLPVELVVGEADNGVEDLDKIL